LNHTDGPRVIVIGAASLNTVVDVEALPQARPHTITAVAHRRVLGGTSAGKSLHLADRGLLTLCVTAVGDDADGVAIRDELSVPLLEVLAVVGDGPTEHHLNLMTPSGERLSIYLNHAPRVNVTAAERAQVVAVLQGASAIALDLSQLGLAFVDDARAAPAPVWVDLHDYDGAAAFHAPFIAAADLVLMNADGMPDPLPFLRAQVADGALAAVCTLGAEGAMGVAGDGTVVRVPAVPTEVLDTNGAGDAFTAGMIDVVVAAASREIGPELLARAMATGAQQAVTALRSPGVGPAPGAPS